MFKFSLACCISFLQTIDEKITTMPLPHFFYAEAISSIIAKLEMAKNIHLQAWKYLCHLHLYHILVECLSSNLWALKKISWFFPWSFLPVPAWKTKEKKLWKISPDPWNMSRMSNIESNKSQNGDLEDYNNISTFTTPSLKISLG